MPRRRLPTIRDVGRANRSTVLQLLYFGGPSGRPQLTRRSGLSQATVANIVGELLGEGVLVETGLDEPGVGRPSTILEVNPDYGYFVGVDLGENQIQIELFDLTLNKVGAVVDPLTRKENEPGHVVELIARETEDGLREAGIAPESVLGVGIGVPGIVRRADEVTVHVPSWNWQEVPLLSMLGEELALPIFIDNGAKAMAQAEMWFGAGRGFDDIAVLLIGTGVGAGIIVGGSLFRGATNSAGEWGHTTIERGGRSCRCGNVGCLEAYVGAGGIIARFLEQAPGSTLVDPRDEMRSIENLVEAAEAGDSPAAEVLAETADLLGGGIANLVNLFNPELVVLGGWIGVRIGPHILPRLRQNAEVAALRGAFEGTRIELGELEDDAVAMGAATLALEVFLSCAGAVSLRSRSAARPELTS